MTITNKEVPDAAGGPAGANSRRWLALSLLTAMQFMLVMDVTVVNIALPRIQDDLDFSYEGLAWVVNAYVLVAGGFLLLGGRLADLFGRRRIFMIGVLIFGVSSIACGAATASWALVVSRFVQGLGEALAGPAALGLIPMLFPDRAERMKALGIWSGIGAMGGAVGSVVGGALTDLVNWRWVFFINVPIALVALFLVPRVIAESRMVRTSRRVDVVGAITATGGLVAIVYGLLEAAEHSWTSTKVLLPLLVGGGLLLFMGVWESRVKDPMIPLRFFTNRTRVTANFLSVASLAAFHTYAFLLTLYVQQLLGYSPMKTGLSYIPLTIAMGLGIGLSTSLLPRLGVKPVITVAFLGSALGLFVAAEGLGPDASYVSRVMPGLIVFGFFNAVGFPALINAALHRVTGQDSGLASGMQTSMQQIGAALGLATLVPLALRYVTDHVQDGTPPVIAQTDGYALALRVGAGVLAITGVLAVLVLEKVSAEKRDAAAETADAEAAKFSTSSDTKA